MGEEVVPSFTESECDRADLELLLQVYDTAGPSGEDPISIQEQGG